MDPEALWAPGPERIENAEVSRFQAWLEARLGQSFADYEALWRWSVADIDAFWAAIWEYFELGDQGGPVLGRREMPGAEWFPGARVNYAERIFADRDPDAVAIRFSGEIEARLGTMTWGELRGAAARIAAALRSRGVGPGDRVVAYVPNVPEAIAAFLACASLGAVWSSCSPDFGLRSVVDRFAQIEPKVLIAVDGYRYGGRDFDRREVVAALQHEMPSLTATVLLPYLDPDATLAGATPWLEFLGAETAELEFEQLPFDHPLWVLYSSGTTGLPKAIVQGHGGILIEQIKHHRLHLDAAAGDRVLWFTTTGWMMWNFLVGVLLTEASIVLFDGNPGHPTLDVLWNLAEEAEVTCFGTSASFLAACMKAGVRPAAGRNLGALRSVGSTGSPLSPEGFAWVYEEVGADTWLFSTSGGTDVCTPFVGGVPTLPVYRGELQARLLGCDVEAFDEAGRPLVGAVGELVVTQPMPSMPIYLWNDPDGERYRDAYFDMYPGVWRHGDWVEITSRGTTIIYGRSDSTINRGGIRMGTSEIYRAVLSLERVTDALVLDVDGWMPLFVVLREGDELDQALERSLAARIRDYCSPRHVPNEVHAIAAVPRTISGKIVEVPIKRILQGTPPERAVSRDSMADPAALDWFAEFAKARRGRAPA
jgi:acetoacetyl-CoA synthetase